MRATIEIILNTTSTHRALTEKEIDIITDCIKILELKGLDKCFLKMLADAWPDQDDLNYKAWLVSTTLPI